MDKRVESVMCHCTAKQRKSYWKETHNRSCVASPSVESLQVEVRMKEGAFRDRADNKNEEDALEFTAKPLRCGSAYLASYMKDDCQCYSRMGRCVCDCGVNLFEL